MDSREDFPRISVDSFPDWRRIETNYTRTAFALLESKMASHGLIQEKEAMSFHLNKFIESTFAIAQPNLRVNGRNFEDFGENEEGMEGFDEDLDRGVWCLSDQRLRSDSSIADKRRDKPRQIESLFCDHLRSQDVFDIKDAITLTAEDIGLDGDLLSHHPTYERVFQKIFALAKELQQSMPTQHERSTSVKKVSAEVKALRT